MEPHVPAFQQLGLVAKRAGSRLPGNTPNSLYVTRDGRHIVIAAASDPVFRRLAETMGQPELGTDPRFATALARVRNAAECERYVEAWVAANALADVHAALERAKVPAAPIYTVEDIFNDEQYAARDMLVDVDDPVLGPVTVTGVVPKLSETPGQIRWAGRQPGEDTTQVLREELNMDDETIAELLRTGVVAEPKS